MNWMGNSTVGCGNYEVGVNLLRGVEQIAKGSFVAGIR